MSRREYLFFFLLLLMCSQALSQFRVYGGKYTEPDRWFAGLGYKIGLPIVSVIPNAEYVFVDNATLGSVNVDGTIGFLVVGYVGAGIGMSYSKVSGADMQTRGLFNLLAGVELSALPLSPFLQAKYAIISGSGNDPFVIGIGIHL
jgi:hypothetical protein